MRWADDMEGAYGDYARSHREYNLPHPDWGNPAEFATAEAYFDAGVDMLGIQMTRDMMLDEHYYGGVTSTPQPAVQSSASKKGYGNPFGELKPNAKARERYLRDKLAKIGEHFGTWLTDSDDPAHHELLKKLEEMEKSAGYLPRSINTWIDGATALVATFDELYDQVIPDHLARRPVLIRNLVRQLHRTALADVHIPTEVRKEIQAIYDAPVMSSRSELEAWIRQASRLMRKLCRMAIRHAKQAGKPLDPRQREDPLHNAWRARLINPEDLPNLSTPPDEPPQRKISRL